jgi:hypothetical protein
MIRSAYIAFTNLIENEDYRITGPNGIWGIFSPSTQQVGRFFKFPNALSLNRKQGTSCQKIVELSIVQLEEHFYCTSTGCLLKRSNLVRKRAIKNFCLVDGDFYRCNHTNYLMHKNNE